MNPNFFKRLLRLPFVAKVNPVITAGLWIGAAVLNVALNNRSDPNVQDIIVDQVILNDEGIPQNHVLEFSPFKIFNFFIQRFFQKRNVNNYSIPGWFLHNAWKLGVYVAKSTFRASTNNAVEGNQIPNIVAGRIPASNLIQNMPGSCFVIGISNEVLNFIGLILTVFRYFIFVYFIFLLTRFLKNRILKDSFIDVKAIEVKGDTTSKDDQIPSHLKKYIRKL